MFSTLRVFLIRFVLYVAMVAGHIYLVVQAELPGLNQSLKAMGYPTLDTSTELFGWKTRLTFIATLCFFVLVVFFRRSGQDRQQFFLQTMLPSLLFAFPISYGLAWGAIAAPETTGWLIFFFDLAMLIVLAVRTIQDSKQQIATMVEEWLDRQGLSINEGP
ncbi:MAG: hypothetical protein AB203_01530 [Parcubacteria bacterium C7867-008]|nr:MAG: hypothetical protein AB203_01530 [Parcubacteria bacterium C7867-008]